MMICEICDWSNYKAEKICEKCGFFLHSHNTNSLSKDSRYITHYPFLNKHIYNKYNFIHLKNNNHSKNINNAFHWHFKK